MSDSDYNGWKNYETWNIALWIDNDEGIYHFVLHGIMDLLDQHDNDWQSISECEIRELVDDAFNAHKTPDGVSVHDPKIDWSEISDALLEMAEGNNLQTSTEGN